MHPSVRAWGCGREKEKKTSDGLTLRKRISTVGRCSSGLRESTSWPGWCSSSSTWLPWLCAIPRKAGPSVSGPARRVAELPLLCLTPAAVSVQSTFPIFLSVVTWPGTEVLSAWAVYREICMEGVNERVTAEYGWCGAFYPAFSGWIWR